MAATTDEITLDIDALDAEAAKNAKPGANGADLEQISVETAAPETKQPGKADVTPQEGIEKLQRQLADERAGRLAAEARATEAAQGEAKARETAQTSQLDQIKGAIAQATQTTEVLKAKYAEAASAGDWAAASEVQAQMADNAADLRELKRGQVAIEKAPKPVPRAPTDPVEAFATQLSPQSAAWVRANSEFVRDNHKHQQMLAAHQLAMARGLKADTPEYFTSIEKTLDITSARADRTLADDSVDDPMASAAQPVNGGRRAAPAAPVSRSVTNSNGTKPGSVKLTPAQIEAAHSSFPDSKTPLEDYARQVLALRKEGKLS